MSSSVIIGSGRNESGDLKANGEPWICLVYGVVVLRWPEGCSMVVAAWQGGERGQNNYGRRFSQLASFRSNPLEIF